MPVAAHATSDVLLRSAAPFEKATIRYTISGLENGYEILYIRDFGQKMAKYRFSTMKVMGVEKVTETAEFVDPEWIYTFDLQRRTGTKSANPMKYIHEEYSKLDDREKRWFADQGGQLRLGPTLGGMSGELAENVETILGYACDKAQFVGAEIYTIHNTNIPLRTEASIMEMRMLVEAVKIEVDSAPQHYFQHPQDITPKYDPKGDSVARALAEKTIALLQDPETVRDISVQEEISEFSEQQPDPLEQEEVDRAIEILKKTAQQ